MNSRRCERNKRNPKKTIKLFPSEKESKEDCKNCPKWEMKRKSENDYKGNERGEENEFEVE